MRPGQLMRAATAIFLLLAAPANAAPPWLAGTWFGTGQPDDRSEMFLDTMTADGGFRAHHRWCRKGKPFDQYQLGRWKLDGDRLTITVASVNGKPSGEVDVYRILSHDAHSQRYMYLPLNFSYTSRRADGMTMPDCDLVS